MKEKKQRSFLLFQEDLDYFLDWVEEEGLNQAGGFKKLIQLLKVKQCRVIRSKT